LQFECSDRHRPPPGCTQYHTGVSGTLNSYNFAGGYHLANMDYSHCIRTERGYCSIWYHQVSASSFKMSGTNAATAPGVTGDSCATLDHVTIPQGAQSVAIAVASGSVDQ